MENKILLLANESKYFWQIKPAKRWETIMFLTIYRSGGIKEPHYIYLYPDTRKLLPVKPVILS